MTTEPTTIEEAEAGVRKAFASLVAASCSLDAEHYLALVDMDRFSGLGADGKAWHSGKDLELVIRAGFAAVEHILALEFSNMKVTVINPSTAILVNEYKQKLRLKTQEIVEQAGGGTQVWSRTALGWQLVSIAASDARRRDTIVF